jgi:chorismate synthase
MFGSSIGRLFQVTIAGGSYQEGMTTHLAGVPAGMRFTEEEIYSELLLRKPGQGELASPRKEPDVPIIYSGTNVADPMEGVKSQGLTNGTPLVILIPNLDRQQVHIEQYRTTNRTPRPGHASYASFHKYGIYDDAIGAGIFSGRYTSTLVAAGVAAKRVLAEHGIQVTGYVKEAAGIRCPDVALEEIRRQAAAYRKIRKEHDPVYAALFASGKYTFEMRFLEKCAALARLWETLETSSVKTLDLRKVQQEHGVHPLLLCPHLETANAMVEKIVAVKDEGDSTGGLVEVVATGLPAGVGEPPFDKLDGELGRMLSIAAVKAVEVGMGLAVKDAKGSQVNDQMYSQDGKVKFASNHAGGITGGLSTGQDIIVRLAVKPTPTIGKPQRTIDKLTNQDAQLAAVTRRDPTIVARVWPVAEAFVAIILLDHYMQYVAQQHFLDRPEHPKYGRVK